MKKAVSLLLVLTMLFALAGCNKKEAGGDTAKIDSALDALEQVWKAYKGDKFACMGGDYGSPVENKPGNYSLAEPDMLDYSLGIPSAEVAKIDQAASLVHMMNANTFTAAAYHLTSASDKDGVVSAIKANILDRDWMCGFPDTLVIYTSGEYIITAFGNEDLIKSFKDAVSSALGADLAVEEAL